MIKINIYAITDPSLLDDDVLYSVCNGTPGMIDGLKGFIYDNANTNPEDGWMYLMDGDYIFNSTCAFGAIKDSQVRGMFLADLYSALEEHEVHINHIDIEVKFHIITPDGQIYVIHDFNKISSNLFVALNIMNSIGFSSSSSISLSTASNNLATSLSASSSTFSIILIVFSRCA